MTTPIDTTEKGLEDLVVLSLVEEADYDRVRALDTGRLCWFLSETRPDELVKVGAEVPRGAKRCIKVQKGAKPLQDRCKAVARIFGWLLVTSKGAKGA